MSSPVVCTYILFFQVSTSRHYRIDFDSEVLSIIRYYLRYYHISDYEGPALGSGSSISYYPVTPLSCDCAKTLIKSCALAYHPIAGCALATTDLGTCVSVSQSLTLYFIIIFINMYVH